MAIFQVCLLCKFTLLSRYRWFYWFSTAPLTVTCLIPVTFRTRHVAESSPAYYMRSSRSNIDSRFEIIVALHRAQNFIPVQIQLSCYVLNMQLTCSVKSLGLQI
jgi:hypothetical protein